MLELGRVLGNNAQQRVILTVADKGLTTGADEGRSPQLSRLCYLGPELTAQGPSQYMFTLYYLSLPLAVQYNGVPDPCCHRMINSEPSELIMR